MLFRSAPNVTVITPPRRNLVRAFKAPGTVEAYQEVTLYAKASGYLSRILVDRGDRVRKAQVLAEISVPEMARERDVVAAQLDQAQAQLKVQQITSERLASVGESEPGAVTRQQIDEAQGQFQIAQGNVARLRAELGRLDELVAYATIRAPFAGVVTERFVDPGALIQSGTGSAQARLVTLMNMDTVRVFVDVSEPDVPFVSRRTPARLLAEALPGESFGGTVTRYSIALDPGTRTMKTEIDFPNPGGRLRPGMYGVVTLDLETHTDALTIPATALLVEKDAAYVFTVVGGVAKRTAVKTGLNDGLVVEIEQGLSGGESVIVAGKGLVSEGMRVVVGSHP